MAVHVCGISRGGNFQQRLDKAVRPARQHAKPPKDSEIQKQKADSEIQKKKKKKADSEIQNTKDPSTSTHRSSEDGYTSPG